MDRVVMDRLLQRAYLYDDPAAYRAGVEAAWRALAPPSPGEQAARPAPAQPLPLTTAAR